VSSKLSVLDTERDPTASRRLPLRTKGASLLSGNVFCAHCGGRLRLTTTGKSYTRKLCLCDGQTGYTMTKLDGIMTSLLLDLVEWRYKSELAVCATKLKTAKAEYKKHTDSLKTLQGEVVNAIQGTSKFD